MNRDRLYILAKVRKLPTFNEYGEYEVIFMYSDKEKNFKRIADCTPEIQKMAVICRPNLQDDFLYGADHCFNIRDHSMVCGRAMPFGEYIKECSHLALDRFESNNDDWYSTIKVIEQMVFEITEGNTNPKDKDDYGKVFVKTGRDARVDVTFDEPKISRLINRYVR